MIGIPLGILYANFAEALFHRYVLHGIGKNPKSFWAYHWNEHHKNARMHAFRDDDYRTRPFFGYHAQTKERAVITLSVLAHLPLLPVAPFFVTTLATCGYVFYQRHKRAHLDPVWGREHMPWHYDHHMGRDQDKNWGIVSSLFDRIVGTRVPYAGTPEEAEDQKRREARARTTRGTDGEPLRAE